MEKKSMQMIAIAIVAIFVIAAVTVVITNNGDDGRFMLPIDSVGWNN